MLRNDIALTRQSGIPSVVLRPSEAVAYDPVTKKPFELDNFESRHIAYLTDKGYSDGRTQIAALCCEFSVQGFK